ncbi:XkdQ/YqbQ family protein [Paenibacillus oleatilyticus]|uniref:YqbQ/XkdQ domain-containing protein n=1 Tax=Paenibacillus oleatilyticus TaxID=2594886 RepID=A0ABV4V3E7_9BACL
MSKRSPSDFILMLMCNEVYDKTLFVAKYLQNYKNLNQMIGKVVLSDWEIFQLPTQEEEQTGFYAAVYYNERTAEFVVAMRGTDGWFEGLPKDWDKNEITENFHLAWDSKEVKHGVKPFLDRLFNGERFQKIISTASDYKIVFTGHSLGGKLAQIGFWEARVGEVGRGIKQSSLSHVVTFNSAGVFFSSSTPSREQLKKTKKQLPVRNYVIQGEILQKFPGEYFGSKIILPFSHKEGEYTLSPKVRHEALYYDNYFQYYMDEDGNFSDYLINANDSNGARDILHGRDDVDDHMYGWDGDDDLYGNGGNDRLFGGAGNDILEGGPGNDIYFFKKGDGNDKIVESDQGKKIDKSDTIKIIGFGLDEIKVNFDRRDVYSPAKVRVTLSFTSSSDTLTFVHSYGEANNIEFIQICDEYQRTIKTVYFKKLADYFTMKHNLTKNDDQFSLTYLLEFGKKEGQAFEAEDPIVMDLDGDGLETVGIEKRVFFDHDGDGESSLTGWVGPDDGLLVRDLNGDGVINNGTELFGEHALLKDGSRSQSGFDALSELDDNGDGLIDKNDAGFAQLKVWKDSNSDGKSAPNELFTLPDLGITAIHTKYYDIGSGNESNSNILVRESSYTKQDGSSGIMGEYLFEMETNRIDPEQFKQIMKRQEEPVFEKKEPPIIHSNQYEVILANQYIITDMVEKITLEESLDEIAYRATIDLVITDDFPAIGPGQEIRISGIAPQGTSLVYLFHPGVIWECSSRNSGQKHLTVTAYDKTIYLNKCEDEYLLPAGQTASQRLKRYAADWGIPLGHVAETGKSLAKSVYRSQTIFSMILNDLKDTVSRDGLMYRARMTPNGLELYEIGSNSPVWMLDMDQNVEEITQKRTLEGAVTQVKVLGKAKEEDKPVPVLAVEKGETEKYGTLQRIIQNSNIETASQAKKAAQKLLTGMQETVTVTAIDINTIRAGDKVQIKDLAFIVTSVRHELGMPGSMTLELMHIDAVRRKYFMAD